MTREEWLMKFTDKLKPLLWDYRDHSTGIVPDKTRVTCGWPSKGAFSSKRRTIGECWSSNASKDGTTEIFISPCVSDSVEVGAVLAHELVHASGCKNHGKSFKRLAESIGLIGPMRSTKAGPQLTDRLNAVIAEIGAYPHAELDKTQSPHKKDGTRLLKGICGACGYTIRLAKKWAVTGMPSCPCGAGEMGLEGQEKEEGEDDGNN